ASACIVRARAIGAERIVLCSRQNMKAAHRIYERLGFERAPQLDWSPLPGLLLWSYVLGLGPRSVRVEKLEPVDEAIVLTERLFHFGLSDAVAGQVVDMATAAGPREEAFEIAPLGFAPGD